MASLLEGQNLAVLTRCVTLPSMTQRRARNRTAVRLPVSIGGRLPALTADISPAGFRAELMTMATFLPGSQVHGFVLEGDRELTFRGEVTWAQAGDPQATMQSELGVRFTDVSPELKALLKQKKRAAAKKKKA
ncbi:MAG: PilZ domain-containing protein [Myxococcaceae bacterium]